MIVRRVGPLSAAKIAGVLYAFFGFIAGCFISLFSMVGAAFAPQQAGLPGMLFGVGAIILLPIVYGLLGFVFSLIGAGLYNLIAGWVGGIELDLQ
jgi:hypothetical protein